LAGLLGSRGRRHVRLAGRAEHAEHAEQEAAPPWLAAAPLEGRSVDGDDSSFDGRAEDASSAYPGALRRRPVPRVRRPLRSPGAALRARVVAAEAAGWGPMQITIAFNNCASVGDVEAVCLAYRHSLSARHLTAAAQALARLGGRGRQGTARDREWVRASPGRRF
jgi:hypothetical protein